MCLCVLERSAAEPGASPTPRGNAFSQAGEDKVQEGSCGQKDAVVPGARADIPVPGCCRHVSPGPEADSTNPAETDAHVNDPSPSL